MEKKCFVIMPTIDPSGYAQGHFNRVFQYIIVPACRLAGFSPVRADDPSANDTAMDIIKNIIECDIAICDLSSKNPNALYGFAIRQGVNLPVTLIKDIKTQPIFGIQEFGEVEYDESLRIDTVQKEIETLSHALEKTFANKGELNSLLSRLDIGSAKALETQNISEPMDIVSSKKEESHLPVITPVPEYVGDPITQHEQIDKLKVGDFLFHINYGKGEIKSIRKLGNDKMSEVNFDSGSKKLVLVISGVWRKIIE
ncbi:MAG: hypothetical protein JJE09_07225 [Bacteroidia bacterium]|nr:hypothetical protein [Bacteroidia bacterium]